MWVLTLCPGLLLSPRTNLDLWGYRTIKIGTKIFPYPHCLGCCQEMQESEWTVAICWMVGFIKMSSWKQNTTGVGGNLSVEVKASRIPLQLTLAQSLRGALETLTIHHSYLGQVGSLRHLCSGHLVLIKGCPPQGHKFLGSPGLNIWQHGCSYSLSVACWERCRRWSWMLEGHWVWYAQKPRD